LAATLSNPSAQPTDFLNGKQFNCHLCKIKVKSSSKHCGTCNRCVPGFDHHCVWLNNCIGEKNYKLFLTLIAVYPVQVAILGWAVFYEQQVSQLRWFWIVMFVYLILKLILLLALNVWHYWIVYEGISTY
jgi:DHHC palmitoyltransferase